MRNLMPGAAARRACSIAVAALALAVGALTIAGCTGPKNAEERAAGAAAHAVGPFRMSLGHRPLPPSVGDNTLTLALRDSSGAPVRGARAVAVVVMEAMGQMPRMESRGEFKEGRPGVYEAKYRLQMGGEWDVRIHVEGPGGGSADVLYRISTSTKDVTFVEGTPPRGAAAAPQAGNAAAGGAEIAGTVTIDPARRQAIGIRTGVAAVRDLRVTIRAAGRVAYDESRRAELSLKFGGWVRDLRADFTGRVVRAGDVLFTAYSPELVAAQEEYLTALGAGVVGGTTPGDASSDIAAAARQRLLRWDIAPAQVDAIARAGKPIEALPILAPVSGIVVEKNIVQGSAFAAGQTLYKFAPVHPVWVVANVYPFELSLVHAGMPAAILTPFLAEKSRAGRVSYVSPYLESDTRTGEVRIDVPNQRGDLKPGMFVDVTLDIALGKRLAVPESAVLYAGDRRIVFVDLGGGRLAPREVSLGSRAGDYFEVRSGLVPGDSVVTSGNFLVAAESKLKSAAQKW